ncbi:MAG TPA: PilW family protein [Xanthomonadaceae bacterium]|nr:PilW family protein [Xanthomonadaceae bacterium]
MTGFSLIELMVAMVLGLIVTGATLTVFISNRQTYAATESLGRIQENARTAFELMARDLREAAGNACGNTGQMTKVNVLVNATSNWYTDWTAGIQGFDGTAPGLTDGTAEGNRVAGTDVIDIRSSTSTDVNIVPDPGGNPAEIKVSTNAHGLAVGDVVVACDPAHMAVFQVTGANASNVTVVHNTGSSVTPGNCSKGLGDANKDGLPVCTTNGDAYKFGCFNGDETDCGSGRQWPAILAKMKASRWYVGYNGDGTRSLFHVVSTNSGGVAGTRADEIAEGVQDMQLKYLVAGDSTYKDASAVSAADWANGNVVGIRIELTVNDQQKGTDGQPLTRLLEHTVAIRNRLP